MAYFDNLCPNCRGYVGDNRLEEGLPCSKCLPAPHNENVCYDLFKRRTIKFLKDVCYAEKLVGDFVDFFTSMVGEKPWSLQVTWAKRVFLNRSFAIQAPTGIGKTTFGIVMAAFLQGRSYIILPTKLLVQQVYERLSSLCDKRIVAYTGKKKEKKQIEDGDFDILVTTQAFLQKNIDILPKDFRFIFVDDVDSVLKNPKNVDNLFKLLGLTDEDISRALKLPLDSPKLEYIRKKIRGILVVSSATLKPKTKRVNLFRSLLGFDIQRSVSSLREVEDLYIEAENWEEAKSKALRLIEKLQRGIFIFVPNEKGKAAVEELVQWLNKQGISAVSYEDFDENIEAFKKGDIRVAVGIAISNNALVRGIDLPYWVRAAVFMDVPKFIFPLRVEPDPSKLFTLLRLINTVLKDEKLNQYLSYLKKYSTMTKENLDKYPSIKEKVSKICEYLSGLLEREDIRRLLIENDNVYLTDIEGETYVVVGDAVSYIQASGRTSRLIPGGITKGLSVVIVVDRKAFNSLAKRVRYLLPQETQFKKFENFDELDDIIKELDKSRNPSSKERKELFKSALVVVESPNKARTISNFFGKPQRRWLGNILVYEVAVGNLYLLVSASIGHVLDLTTKPGFFGVIEEDHVFKPVYTTIKRCACGQQLVDNLCPKCGDKIEQDKLYLLEDLRRLTFEVDEVYIATDPDAEGEKIAWDLYLALRLFSGNVRRIEFHEVTPVAFRRALEDKRDVDEYRVKAQIVRRIADRWVGFTLSQRLQREFGNRHLSAGRVQTPVLGWVINRDEETRKKKGVVSFKVFGVPFSLEAEPDKAADLYKKLNQAKITLGEEFVDQVKPPPPFTTSELLKEASNKLGLSAEEVMHIAQKLFEEGYITYHRTDSTRVSFYGIAVARDYIEEHFPGYFKARVWGEGGAHECIRPTRAIEPKQLEVMANSGEVDLDKNDIKLYSLIFYRFIASQMKEAQVVKRVIKVSLDNIESEKEVITHILEPGFSVILPIKAVELKVDRGIEEAKLAFVPKERPYTEGSLVDEMKKRGLGRPSTYAKIVQTLLARNYVIKKGIYLRSTPLGRKVYDYLKQFEPYTSEEFTRIIEKYMDEIEEKQRDYTEVLRTLYDVRIYLPQT
ncbi:reverse gyrase [Thermosulfidibacter takaii]|nr:reverse gyrase [Thermosulfidibacter takaii]